MYVLWLRNLLLKQPIALATLCFHAENVIPTCQFHKLVIAIWLKPIGIRDNDMEGVCVVCFISFLVKFTERETTETGGQIEGSFSHFGAAKMDSANIGGVSSKATSTFTF